MVECATCGGDLDPLEVLRDFARQGDRYLYILDEKKKLSGECESLRADIKRLKGQRRRLRDDLHRVGIGVRMVIATEIERSLGWVAGKRPDQITAVLARLVATVRNYDVTDVVDVVDKAAEQKAKSR